MNVVPVSDEEPADDEGLPMVSYAGIGGIGVCCLGIELLGGAVILGGLAATLGLSTGVTYVAVAGLGGAGAAATVFIIHRLTGQGPEDHDIAPQDDEPR